MTLLVSPGRRITSCTKRRKGSFDVIGDDAQTTILQRGPLLDLRPWLPSSSLPYQPVIVETDVCICAIRKAEATGNGTQSLEPETLVEGSRRKVRGDDGVELEDAKAERRRDVEAVLDERPPHASPPRRRSDRIAPTNRSAVESLGSAAVMAGMLSRM